MTQEKLEQRWENFMSSRRINSTSKSWIEFARAELQKAAEIAQSYGGLQSNMVAEKIRKLMD